MRTLVVTMMMMIAQVGLAQEPGQLTGVEKASNGDVVVTGIDPLGAEVTVVYNDQLMKVYQERTLEGETMFARYHEGVLTDYGMYSKPVAVGDEKPVLNASVR